MKRRKATTNMAVTPKTIINPEYEGSEDQKNESANLSHTIEEYWTFQPEEAGAKIPPDGCWIMVKQPPHTEFTVPPLSMWYAVEDVRPHAVAGQARHLAKILTPKGDLWLWPGEYVCVKDVSVYFGFPEEHIHINLLGGEGVNPDKLFYIRSRGISKKEAIKMLIGEVKSQDVAYVTVHPEYGRIFSRVQPEPSRLAFTEEWPGEEKAA